MLDNFRKYSTPILMLALLLILGNCSDKDKISGPFKPPTIRGDINLNGIANEVADAVLFSNYFVYGLDVFTIEIESQIIATDLNGDGLTLSVADLVSITRIVIGDALPYAKTTPLEVRYTHDRSQVLTVKDDVQIGAVHLVVAGNANPTLLADNMEMQYAYNGTNTSILLWSLEGNWFTGDFINVYGEVVSIEMATYEGQPVILEQFVPSFFNLYQNNPNPFADSTAIRFDLARDAEVLFEIINDSGQVVFEYSQYYLAGVSSFIWNATAKFGLAVPDGKYTCTMIIGDKQKSIEMLKAD